MNCREFQSILDDFLGGSLPGAIQAAADAHLCRCSACRDLADLVREAFPLPQVPVPAGLTEAILARTSGPACSRAAERLANRGEGPMDPTREELLRSHLEGCAGCRSIAAALDTLALDLPSLAEMRPPESLLPQVLAATSGEGFGPAWRVRWKTAWTHFVERPRFAFEAAYAGLVLLVLLFGLPFRHGIDPSWGANFDPSRLRPVQTLFARDGLLADSVHSAGVRIQDRVADEAKAFSTWLEARRDVISRRWANAGNDDSEEPGRSVGAEKEIEK